MLSVLVVLVVAACQERPAGPSERPRPTASSAVLPQPSAEAGAAEARQDRKSDADSTELDERATLRLLDPGKAPRQVLRHDLAVGQTTRWSVTLQALTQVGEDPPQTMDLGVEVRARVETADADGATIGLTLAELSAIDDPTAGAAWRSLSGRRASVRVDRRGRLGLGPRLEDEPMDVATRQLWASVREAVIDAWPPYPFEAVGVGARWTVTRGLVRGGVRLRRTTRFELRERDEQLRIRAQLEEAPRPGGYADPALGGAVTLEALKGTGIGRRRWSGLTDGGFALHAETEIATDLLVRVRLATPDAPPPADRLVKTTQVSSLSRTSPSAPSASPSLDPPPETSHNAP